MPNDRQRELTEKQQAEKLKQEQEREKNQESNR